MGGATLTLWVDRIGKHNHLVLRKALHWGLRARNKRSLFSFTSSCGQKPWLFILKPQTVYQFVRTRRAVAPAKFSQNMSSDSIDIARRLFAERILYSLLLIHRQRPRTLSVIL